MVEPAKQSELSWTVSILKYVIVILSKMTHSVPRLSVEYFKKGSIFNIIVRLKLSNTTWSTNSVSAVLLLKR